MEIFSELDKIMDSVKGKMRVERKREVWGEKTDCRTLIE